MGTNNVTLEGLVSENDLNRAYKKRNVKYISKTVVRQYLQPFFDEGWEKQDIKVKSLLNCRN